MRLVSQSVARHDSGYFIHQQKVVIRCRAVLAGRKQLKECAALFALAAVLAGVILLDSNRRAAPAVDQQEADDDDGSPDIAPLNGGH